MFSDGRKLTWKKGRTKRKVDSVKIAKVTRIKKLQIVIYKVKFLVHRGKVTFYYYFTKLLVKCSKLIVCQEETPNFLIDIRSLFKYPLSLYMYIYN